MSEQGIVLVCTERQLYYDSAIMCANSILEYLPSVNITLFTSPKLFNPIHKHYFDKVVLDTPDGVRAKIWGMANTPYELTLYLDADMWVVHDDFASVFDQVGRYDMLWTRISKEREYAYNTSDGSNISFPGGDMELHGGVCLYRDTAKKFMKDWYNLDLQMRNKEWWPSDTEKYPLKFRKWDQFPLWWLTNKEWSNYKYLTYDFFQDDFRWNFLHTYDVKKEGADVPGKEPIILHHNFTK